MLRLLLLLRLLVSLRYGRCEVIGGFSIGVFVMFDGLYHIVEAVQRLVDPGHGHAAADEVDDEPQALALLGLLLSVAGGRVFRPYRLKTGLQRTGRDELMEGVYVLIVAELLARMGLVVSWVVTYADMNNGVGIREISVTWAAALAMANAWPVVHRTAMVRNPSQRAAELSAIVCYRNLLSLCVRPDMGRFYCKLGLRWPILSSTVSCAKRVCFLELLRSALEPAREAPEL